VEAPPLTGKAAELEAKYEKMLASLKREIESSLPAIDEKKKSAFLDAAAALNESPSVEAGMTAAQVAEFKAARSLAESNVMECARALLGDLGSFLGSDKLDGKLMKASILVHGTPRRLAEFAQQGKAEVGLLESLFADEALMKQILEAGGALGGAYGKAMQIYTAILQASERARERGSIFQRLALGTSLEMDSPNPVERYLHYEKAYLDSELDPGFKDMTAWECRFITSGERGLNDLAWFRDMLRTYRPDHIRNPDYKWRYTRIVKSDFPYTSIRKDSELGTASGRARGLDAWRHEPSASRRGSIPRSPTGPCPIGRRPAGWSISAPGGRTPRVGWTSTWIRGPANFPTLT
jgi:hypothetical protein